MERWPALCIVIATFVMAVASWAAEPRLFVTAKDLIASNHRIEVAAGTEIVWNDPHVDRVWSPRTLAYGFSEPGPA